jgi:protein-S-isoprenylcysteine O-methyltransferase Ste14
MIRRIISAYELLRPFSCNNQRAEIICSNTYGIFIVLNSTACLVATAKMEERENISYFGSSYEEYIKGSKMFIPYLF